MQQVQPKKTKNKKRKTNKTYTQFQNDHRRHDKGFQSKAEESNRHQKKKRQTHHKTHITTNNHAPTTLPYNHNHKTRSHTHPHAHIRVHSTIPFTSAHPAGAANRINSSARKRPDGDKEEEPTLVEDIGKVKRGTNTRWRSVKGKTTEINSSPKPKAHTRRRANLGVG
ncbi:unnamed protein product [Rhodiola kirilowii]